jgi:hypothetical protein
MSGPAGTDIGAGMKKSLVLLLAAVFALSAATPAFARTKKHHKKHHKHHHSQTTQR